MNNTKQNTLTHEITTATGFTLTFALRTCLSEIPQEVKDNLVRAAINLVILDDGSICDDSIPNTDFWLTNARFDGVYGEGDKLIKATITGELYDNEKRTDEIALRYARAVLHSITR